MKSLINSVLILLIALTPALVQAKSTEKVWVFSYDRPANFYKLKDYLPKDNNTKDLCSDVLAKLNEPAKFDISNANLSILKVLTQNSAYVPWDNDNPNNVQTARFDLDGDGTKEWIYKKIYSSSGFLNSAMMYSKEKLNERTDIEQISNNNITDSIMQLPGFAKPIYKMVYTELYLMLVKSGKLIALIGEENTSKRYIHSLCNEHYNVFAGVVTNKNYQTCNFVSIPKIQCTKKISRD